MGIGKGPLSERHFADALSLRPLGDARLQARGHEDDVPLCGAHCGSLRRLEVSITCSAWRRMVSHVCVRSKPWYNSLVEYMSSNGPVVAMVCLSVD